MKHIPTFNNFLNELDSRFVKVDTLPSYDKYKDGLAIKLPYGPINLYPKGTPPDWFKDMHNDFDDNDMLGPKGFIFQVIEEWQKQNGKKASRSLIDTVEEISKKFFDKYKYINGNIIYAIIDQNHK